MSFIIKHFKKIGKKGVSVALVDDRTISRLSGQYRGKRHATDVLTFLDPAEIVISLDTARRQAKERGVSLREEILLLVLHGHLHLQGFDDEDAASWPKMKKAEFEGMMSILG
ncbi:MAG: rRNA maturation RNase YbeY [Deltaproteobacteria bacterium]|nr:rRNA maturation RNase YbeY [Deltaproteobacteria bacterium]